MAAIPLHTPEPAVFVEGDAALIHAFSERDPEFVALLREAEEPEQTTHDCLSIGARALRGVQTTVDAAVVDKRFAEFESKLAHGTSEAVRQINEASIGYLDPDNGKLKKVLDQMKAELEQSLGAAFDPKSKESVLAKFEQVFSGGTRNLATAVRDLVDPGNANGPLGRLRGELSGELKEVRGALDKLGEQIAIDDAVAIASREALELSAVKGRRFEAVVFEAVADFVALYQDEPEAVGTLAGAGGSQVGDVLVTLNPADASGGPARYVVEVKDKKLGLKQALDELDRAIGNREAAAGVIVFASLDKAPIHVPCRAYGNKVVVVLDKNDMDTQPLRLALMTAGLVAQRESHAIEGEVDLAGALALVEEAQRVLDDHATIKRCHSAVRNQIASAAAHTADLVDRVDAILSELGNKLHQGA